MILEKLPKNTQFSSQQASDESLLVAVHLSWLISKAHSLQPLFDQIKRNIPFLFVILFHKLDLVRTGEFWVLYSVKFLHSPVVLSSLPRYARVLEGNRWHALEIEKSLIKGLFWKFGHRLGKPTRNIAIPLRLTAAGLLPLHLWAKVGERENTEGLPDRTCGLYLGDAQSWNPCQAGALE